MAEFLLALILFGAVIFLIGIAKDSINSPHNKKKRYHSRSESIGSQKVQSEHLAKANKSTRTTKHAVKTWFALPKGRFLPWSVSVQDPVKGGFLSKEEWDEFSSHYDKRRLDPQKRQRVDSWHDKKLEAYEYNRRRDKDLLKVRKDIKDSIKFSDKNLVKPAYKGETTITRYTNKGLCWYDKKSFWGAQVAALSAIPWIKHDFSCFEFKRNPESVIGCHPDKLYPIVSSNDDAYFLYSLIYDFGYGPNKFAWQDHRMDEDTLKDKATKLYLVEINIGSLYGKKDFKVTKVGITTKSGIVGPGDAFRFSGKFQKHVSVLGCVDYEDGRIAYMKEQVIIKLASEQKQKTFNSIPYSFDKISTSDLNTLGPTEWIFIGSPKKRAVHLFAQVVGEDLDQRIPR